MINQINESIYNYIFSINESAKQKINYNEKECQERLNSIISKKYQVIADFWNENVYDFNENCVTKIQTLGSPNAQYIYRNFPRMTSETIILFLDYKLDQIRNSIMQNGDFLEDKVLELMENIDSIGIKKIFDYAKGKNVIEYIGNVYKAYDNNPARNIVYSNIKVKNIKVIPQTDSDFRTGFLIDYRSINKLPDTPNGTLYVVKDDKDKRYVIKLFNKNILIDKLIRFRHEIYFGKYHHHENIIEVIDNGLKRIDGKDYMFYVMPEYKCNFRELMKNGIEDEKILNYFNQILEGVKFLHSKDAFHRDIKPENILYDETTDKLVVSDLGIAHFCEDDLIDDPKTKSTDRLANYLYAAPEQRDRNQIADKRCDIYALGLILNEIFTKKILSGTNFMKISEANNNFAFLDSVVEKMTSQSPVNRYNSIEEVQKAINYAILLHNANKETERLQSIKIRDSEEKDTLMLEPVNIVNVNIEEDGLGFRLIITLNHAVNENWIGIINCIDRNEVMGHGTEEFSFKNNIASINLSEHCLNLIPQIVEYFSKWVENMNKIYPQKIRAIRKLEEQKKETEIQKKIAENKKLEDIIKQIKY